MQMFDIPNPFKPTTIKKAQAAFEKSTKSEAEWERKYWTDGEWVDIHSNFSWDVSKAGDRFLRAQRWDGGFRSYREDRGLELRKKQKPDRQTIEDAERGFGKAFITGAAKSTLTSLALYGLSFVPGPVGTTVRTINAFAKSKLFLGAALGVTAASVATSIAKGEKASLVLAETVGGLLGSVTGSALGKKIGPTLKPNYLDITGIYKGTVQRKNFIQKMAEAPDPLGDKLRAQAQTRSDIAKAREAAKRLTRNKKGSFGILGGPGGLQL
jgi:hypothetical protein